MMITANIEVGEIVKKFPNAALIFKKYQIDYCCGGKRSLEDVCLEQRLDIETLISELTIAFENTSQTDTDWSVSPIDNLVVHILQAHHAYLYETLPRLSELTIKILRAHGLKHPELENLFKTFHELKLELDSHLIKEETVQYPAIREYLKTNNLEDLKKAVDVIEELESEHDNAGAAIKAIRKITKDFFVPEDVCETFRTTYKLLEELEQNTFTHIHLENNILFQRLKELK